MWEIILLYFIVINTERIPKLGTFKVDQTESFKTKRKTVLNYFINASIIGLIYYRDAYVILNQQTTTKDYQLQKTTHAML